MNDESQYSEQPEQQPAENDSTQFQTPQQGEGEAEPKSFWQRNGATIITVAILGLIIGGAIAVNEQRKSDDSLLGQNQEDTLTDNGQGQTDDDQNQTDDGLIAGGDSDQQPNGNNVDDNQQNSSDNIDRITAAAIALRITGDQNVVETERGSQIVVDENLTIRITEANGENRISAVAVTAVRGEGRTHLARHAITETLRKTDIDLSNEQRVYAEDFLQEQYKHVSPLVPGETVEFSGQDISQAISAAQSLTPAQLDNLEKWSTLVNWPPI